MKVQDSEVIINLILSDITEVKYDAIVNPSNAKLKLLGGVSGVILKKGSLIFFMG